MEDQAKYFVADVYFTHLATDRMAYKACSEEACRRKVQELDSGRYKCAKCGRVGADFNYRYLLRGTFADATDSAWFTAFDEAAAELLGAPASEMMDLQGRERGGIGSRRCYSIRRPLKVK